MGRVRFGVEAWVGSFRVIFKTSLSSYWQLLYYHKFWNRLGGTRHSPVPAFFFSVRRMSKFVAKKGAPPPRVALPTRVFLYLLE